MSKTKKVKDPNDCENYASAFCFKLRFMVYHGWKVRPKKYIIEKGDENRLEWYKPNKISADCWIKTWLKLGKTLEEIKAEIDEYHARGEMMEIVTIDGMSKYRLKQMIGHGLVDDQFQITERGIAVAHSFENYLKKIGVKKTHEVEE